MPQTRSLTVAVRKARESPRTETHEQRSVRPFVDPELFFARVQAAFAGGGEGAAGVGADRVDVAAVVRREVATSFVSAQDEDDAAVLAACPRFSSELRAACATQAGQIACFEDDLVVLAARRA